VLVSVESVKIINSLPPLQGMEPNKGYGKVFMEGESAAAEEEENG
jgi:hypothetical protein